MVDFSKNISKLHLTLLGLIIDCGIIQNISTKNSTNIKDSCNYCCDSIYQSDMSGNCCL